MNKMSLLELNLLLLYFICFSLLLIIKKFKICYHDHVMIITCSKWGFKCFLNIIIYNRYQLTITHPT